MGKKNKRIKKEVLDIEQELASNSENSEFTKESNNSKLSLTAAFVLVCLFICLTLALAPKENLDIFSNFLNNFFNDFFEIVIVKGLGGAFYELKYSVDMAISTVYSDFSVHKLVIFVTVAVVVRHIPWIADTVVKLLTKPPK